MMRKDRLPALSAIWSSSLIPRAVSLPLLRRTVGKRRRRILERDRRDAQAAAGTVFADALDQPVFVIDAYRGGITFWDWLVLPGGGFWYAFLWPLVGETVLQRLREIPRLRTVLELDGHTIEEMAEMSPAAISQIREAIASGQMEIVNGAYVQPLSQGISGESNIRQLHYGISAIRDALGVNLESYLVADPQFFPQLPQILAGFGIKQVILCPHEGTLGGGASEDVELVHWRGPDGTELPAALRYQFMDHNPVGKEQKGLTNGDLTGSYFDAWDNERLERFRSEAVRMGIRRPLISRLVDLLPPRAPFPGIAAVAARRDIRFVTPREYFALAAPEAPAVSYSAEQFPSAVPWGLGGGRLQRDIVEAEGGLLLAERLDALAYAMGRNSEEEKIGAAWKELLRAQDQDLHLCGPRLSRRHGRSMAEVGQDMAVMARKKGAEVSQGAAAFLASLIDSTSLQGRPFVLFNPSSWTRHEYVEVTLKGNDFRVSRGGQEVPSQVVHRGVGDVTLGFVVDVPALGYQLLDILPSERAPEPGSFDQGALAATDSRQVDGLDVFDNSFYSARFGPQGSLCLDVGGITLVDGGFLTVWKNGHYHDSRESAGRVEMVQQGPVFERYRTDGRLARIPFSLWFTLYRNLPRIDLRVEFDFGSGCTFGPQLADNSSAAPYHIQDEKKLCLNFLSTLRRSFSDSPFLVSDVEGERITGVSLLGLDDERGTGVALLNRGTPAYHFDRDKGELRNVLAWAPERWADPIGSTVSGEKSNRAALRGGYAYECSLLPFASRLKALQAAIDYQLPCLGVLLRPRPGRLPAEGSFLKVGTEEVLLSALLVQKGKVYARVWNASSESRQASLASGGPIALHACSLDLTPEAAVDDGIVLRPWGIQTLRLGGSPAR